MRLLFWATMIVFSTVAAGAAPDSTTLEKVRFDGLYVSGVKYGEVTSRTFARFYPDGVVLLVAYAGKLNPQEVQKRMFKEAAESGNISVGTYQVQGEKISLAIASKYASSTIVGKFEGADLILTQRLTFSPWSRDHELPPDVNMQVP